MNSDRYFIGQIAWFAFGYSPKGFMPCRAGMVLTRNRHAALFAVIGYSYGGAGEQFHLPDMSAEALMPGNYGGFHMCVEGIFPQLNYQ